MIGRIKGWKKRCVNVWVGNNGTVITINSTSGSYKVHKVSIQKKGKKTFTKEFPLITYAEDYVNDYVKRHPKG